MPELNEVKQPLWKRLGKAVIGAGITAAYATGIALAAPITLGITAALGAARGLALRDAKKQGLLSALGKGAVQGMMAPFAASATLAIDAARGEETNMEALLKKSGAVAPGSRQPTAAQEETKTREEGQPLWKRIGKGIAGAAMLGATIAACAVAGPAVATFVAIASVTGGYKGYKEAKTKSTSKFWGVVKGAVNRVISPLTTGALLIAHGVQGCETKRSDLNIDVFSPRDALAKIAPPTAQRAAVGRSAEEGVNERLGKEDMKEVMDFLKPEPLKPALPQRPMGKAIHQALETPTPVNTHANKRNTEGNLPPPLKPKNNKGAAR